MILITKALCGPGTMLSTSHALSHLILTTLQIVIFFSSFYGWENWGFEGLSNLPKLYTWLSSRDRIYYVAEPTVLIPVVQPFQHTLLPTRFTSFYPRLTGRSSYSYLLVLKTHNKWTQMVIDSTRMKGVMWLMAGGLVTFCFSFQIHSVPFTGLFWAKARQTWQMPPHRLLCLLTLVRGRLRGKSEWGRIERLFLFPAPFKLSSEVAEFLSASFPWLPLLLGSVI